jgi:hypothetical protein
MIPDAFDPPRTHAFAPFSLSVLAPRFADQDFEAVRASADRIRGVFGPDNGWPDAQISHAKNLADLIRHEREFDTRIAFAYALLGPSGDGYLGCLYIKPIKSRREQDRRKQLFQAQAFLWLSSTQAVVDDGTAFASLQAWLSESWPFTAVAWPGRDPGWTEWEALADA